MLHYVSGRYQELLYQKYGCMMKQKEKDNVNRVKRFLFRRKLSMKTYYFYITFVTLLV